jgi:DNA N-6-adenine-methyltransferase (Dam)
MRRLDYAQGECADNLTALAARANAEHHAVERAAREQVQHAVAAGRALLAIKKIVGHGAFMPWLTQHFAGSARTARVYMWLAAQPEAKWQRAANMSLRSAMKEIRLRDTLMGTGGGCEYYTPTLILALAIRVMGGLDLDPAWHPDCQVKAKRVYTAEQNGLAQEWRGRLFLNPPFGKIIKLWIKKAVDAHAAGDVTQAIILTGARTDSGWFRLLDDYPLCFVHRRVPYKDDDKPPFPSVLAYAGPRVARFARTFGEIGTIYIPYAARV